MVSVNYANSGATKKFASTVNFGASGNTESIDYWDYYLNNDWFDNLSYKGNLTNGTYYMGTLQRDQSYKLSICSTYEANVTTNECTKTSVTGNFNVGLLRYGEMFSSQEGLGYSSSKTYYLMNPFSASNPWVACNYGDAYGANPGATYAVRPTIHLKSEITIAGGTGLPNDPYTVS